LYALLFQVGYDTRAIVVIAGVYKHYLPVGKLHQDRVGLPHVKEVDPEPAFWGCNRLTFWLRLGRLCRVPGRRLALARCGAPGLVRLAGAPGYAHQDCNQDTGHEPLQAESLCLAGLLNQRVPG
ncbi:MAG: hypothetical protein H5T99_03605, partial [Moorella sp. (in: Bacteria)]|nr:hypothetical protein [Moorella sp. (in: firmicutes)]